MAGMKSGAEEYDDVIAEEREHKKRRKSRKAQTTNGSNRPAICLRPGALHEIATEAEAALIAADAPFYARGGEIVRPVVDEVVATKGRRTKVARLRAVTVEAMRDHLSHVAQFVKYSGRAKDMVPADPPHDIAKTVLARDGSWSFRPLAGVITTPTLRPDGTVLCAPGYDPATRLLLIAPPAMPPLPEQPTKAQAEVSLELLGQLIEEFPFADEPSRSVALSALMTAVTRGAMLAAPMHAFDAPEAGSGKSYMVDLASVIGTGEIAPVIAAGRDEEETEKRLASELLTGQPIISIDNFNGDLSGDFICQAIERPTIKVRILGHSETRRIDNTVTMFANGNNMRLVGDIVRRVIRSSLDAKLERPELREFKSDPIADVLADRGRYIAAILTIVRAYLAAGCPNTLPPLASFADWSRLVRSALVWLGCADPIDTMIAARDDDPSRTSLRAVVAAWLTVIGAGKAVTVGALVKKAGSKEDCDWTLLRALLAVAAHKEAHEDIDPRRLGHWLARNRGRVVDDHKIAAETDSHTKQRLWSVKHRTAVCG
jgi:putative DNA primase/helicase